MPRDIICFSYAVLQSSHDGEENSKPKHPSPREARPSYNTKPPRSELYIVVQQSDLLAGLESRHAYVGASIAAERVP